MARNRQPVKPLSSAHVTKLVKQESESTQAKRRATQADKLAAKQAQADAKAVAKAVAEAQQAAEQAKREAEHAQEQAAGVLKAQRIDFDALIDAGTLKPEHRFEDYLAEQGFGPDGLPLKAHIAKTPYTGPMVALKTARKTYVKGANGILNNGDKLAAICSRYSREVTVAALIKALELPGNPYLALNPGQQSMNLRNKARHAINEGRLSFAKIQAAYDAIQPPVQQQAA